MIFEETKLSNSHIINILPSVDERGWFAKIFCKDEFKKVGFTADWVQINHSFTSKSGTVRGMHYQIPPFAEIKLVRCIAGEVFDVIIDLRRNSGTFLKWFGTELSADNKKMIYIPEGFAHGFQALTDNCELVYHHSQFYKPDFEAGIKYDDPLINIQWPDTITNISKRDKDFPHLTENFGDIKI